MERITSLSQSLFLAGIVTLGTTTVLAEDQALEPCINGGVSATGLYETQALEDAASGNNMQFTASDDDSIGDGEDDVISAFGGHRDDFLR